MKTIEFPLSISLHGVSTKIRKAVQVHNGVTYDGFLVVYSLLGKRKRVWRSNFEDAEVAARDACRKISQGEQLALTLTTQDRAAYLRASEALVGLKVTIDTACSDYAAAVAILKGKAGIVEAARAWMKQNATELPRITVTDAVKLMEQQTIADRKSNDRQKQLSAILTSFAGDFQTEVHTITPGIISRWLAGLPLADRTRRNYRDCIGFFCRFCILRGYLPKGTDWLEGVQNYTARQLGVVAIYTPEEIRKLLECAKAKFPKMVPFIAIGAFAGLRHAEIARLDWTDVEMGENPNECFVHVQAENSKVGIRRLVPIKSNLRIWLSSHRKPTGKVCPFANTTKQLLKLAKEAGVTWKHNGLRHSFISYRVAECADIPRVSDEAGNSPAIVRNHYLRRVKPGQAAEWFGIVP